MAETSSSSLSLSSTSANEVDDSSSTEIENQTPGVRTILNSLKAPTASHLARKRKTHSNPPPTGMKRRTTTVKADYEPKSITPSSRVREFPDENLTVSAGNLFCSACREPISLKKSIIKLHLDSQKHKTSKGKLLVKEAKQRNIAELLKKYDKEHHPKGETLPNNVHVYRVTVVKSFLKAGIPLSKVDCMRDLLEEHAFSLSGRQHLSETIPFIHQQEIDEIKQEISGKKVSVIFDGTTHVDEALAVLLRFVDNFQAKQRLVCLKLLSKSMTGEELAREIISTLSTSYGIESNRLVASMRDRASVNSVAMATLKLLYPSLLDVGCFSHTLDRVGEHFKVSAADEFTRIWISLFSRSPKARLAWRSYCGRAVPTYSETRWWSRWEVMNQVLEGYPDVEGFLQSSCDNLSPATVKKLNGILTDSMKKIQLKMELASIIDAGEYFVKGTYNLEGDGPLALTTYEELRKIYTFIGQPHYPNLMVCARNVANGNATVEQQPISYGKLCVEPGFEYFKAKFEGELKPVISFFKGARLLSPEKMKDTSVNTSTIDEFASAFPSLSPHTVNGLKAEPPSYKAAVEDVEPSIDTHDWWQRHEEELPHWCPVFKLVLLVQPSSAAAERVFSLLQNSFTQRQSSSLEDYIETSLMLQYNR